MMDAKPRTFSGDLAALPSALRPLTEHRRWVVWRWWRKNPNSKWTKPLHQANNPNAFARSNAPSTWSSYAAAVGAVQAGRADGIGYVLTHADGLPNGTGAIDLDKCRDPDSGEIAAWAQELISETNSYVETTVSGTGLRIIGNVEGADIDKSVAAPDGGEVEFYRHGARYITISGLQIGNCGELRNIDELIDRAYQKFAGEAPPQSRGGARSRASKRVFKTKPAPEWLVERCGRDNLSLQPEVIAEAEAWIAELKRAYEVMPNDDLPWDEWSKRGAALHNATCGVEAGREIFEEWWAKSKP